MGTNNYILLVANTYLENGEKIGYGVETVKIRKALFQQQLKRFQKVEKRDNLITKKEFFNQCSIAIHLLKEFVELETDIQFQYLTGYLKDIESGKYENEYFSIDNYPVNWEAEKQRVNSEIQNFDFDEYLVSIEKLAPGVYKKMCSNDVEFIKVCLDSLNNKESKQSESESFKFSSKENHVIKEGLTNEIYYNLLMQGHKEAVNAFECSVKEMEVDSVEYLYNNDVQLKNQFKTLDEFIIFFKKTTLQSKAKYRFHRHLESQQKIFEKEYFINEVDFLERCIDALNIKIELEKEKYPNFKPKSKIEETGGVSTQGNMFDTLLDSLVYYKLFIIQTINKLNDLKRAKNVIKQPEVKSKITKSIFDYIQNVNNKEAFLEELKTSFPNEKGKSIKVVIELLKNDDILNIGGREFKPFYEELKTSFKRDIGARQGINDVIFEDIHDSIKEPIRKKLNPLILKHKAI